MLINVIKIDVCYSYYRMISYRSRFEQTNIKNNKHQLYGIRSDTGVELKRL